MELLPSIPDNISDVLVRIVRFTELRRGILRSNIRNVNTAEFVPQDLPVREFAEMLDAAIAEHLQNRRLLFRDTANIRFGPGGQMRVRPIGDASAHALLRTNPDEYMELQGNKLAENTLNRRVAEELFRQKCGTYPTVTDWALDKTAAGNPPFENLPTLHDAAD